MKKLSSVIGVLAILLAISSPAFADGGGGQDGNTPTTPPDRNQKAQSEKQTAGPKTEKGQGGNGSPAAREGGLGADGN